MGVGARLVDIDLQIAMRRECGDQNSRTELTTVKIGQIQLDEAQIGRPLLKQETAAARDHDGPARQEDRAEAGKLEPLPESHFRYPAPPPALREHPAKPSSRSRQEYVHNGAAPGSRRDFQPP